MKQVNRIAEGRLIDRDVPITFTFNGRTLQGFRGDTLASALLANGVKIVGRSFKYGRPRGIIAAGVEEPNAILQVGATPSTQVPNVRATEQALYEGLVCRTTNGWPSLEWDAMAMVGKLAGKMMPPGFYYKTMMYSQPVWHAAERVIRKMAGLGFAPTEPDPEIYDKINRHCDLLIIGAGPAGLAAALTAQPSGARIIIVDENPTPGGWLRFSDDQVDDAPARVWVQATLHALRAAANVEVLLRSTATGFHDGNFVTVVERCRDHLAPTVTQGLARQRMHRIRAREVVLASGAHERPLVYANNDVPGCMLAGAVSVYLKGYGVRPGNALVVATNNDAGYQAAIDWLAAGTGSATVVDARAAPTSSLVTRAESAGVVVIQGAVVVDVVGGASVKAAVVCDFDAQADARLGPIRKLAADVIASSGGYSPVVHLSAHLGHRPVWREDVCGFVPNPDHERLLFAGAVTGEFALGESLEQGAIAAHQALSRLGFDAPKSLAISGSESIGFALQALFQVPHPLPTAKAPPQFVDYQLDVSAAAIEIATREGFESVEHVKRYTALGFGTDQGKLSNVNGVAIAAKALGQSIKETGTTMFRPNYTPASFGVMAGRDVGEFFEPKRYTAMQSWHEAEGAAFEDVGQWKRPWYFPRGDETLQAAVRRECLAVRQRVGILDASTLGKIDIQGPDAREFLNRIYTNAWLKLAPGKCRYGLMCSEDGMVMDDGVTACLAPNHFLMTTTTGGAARVLQWLELWHQTEWPELKVFFNSVTDHWATITLSGPESRSLLAPLTDIDLSPTDFAFMDWRAGLVCGLPARVFRISFTGELTYEINVNANDGLALWQALMAAGAEVDLTPYGTETMHVLRAEKGFVIVGQDTDGSVTPEDLGMGWAVAKRKKFSFVGQRGMMRADCLRGQRKQFVGLSPLNPSCVLPEGSQIVFARPQSLPADMVGHVTSSYDSPVLGRSFALALVKGGLDRHGEIVEVSVGPDRWEKAELRSPIFYDPEGARQHV